MDLGEIFNAWEQRKLGDVSNYIKGFAFKSKDYKKDGVRIIQVSDLTKDKIKCSNTNIFVSLELAELNKKYRINKNEIIITTVGSKAEIKESAVGRPIIVAEEGHFLLNQNLVKLTSLQGFDNYFIYSQLLQPRYINYIAAIERGNANQANIAIIDLWQYTFLVPKKLEQQKISMFFKQLDNTIALHQRKLEALKLMKKGFLQQIFPKKGEKVPRLRFADFEEEWEQRKLGEVVERVIRKNKNLKSTLPLTISAKEGLIAQNEFFNKTVASRDVSGYYLVKNGEFAYNKSYSNGYPWGAIKRLNHYDMGVLSTLYIVFKPTNINSDFLEKYYDTTYWHKEISKHAAEGARNHGLLNIAATDFFESKLTVPKDCDEQEKVGMLFCHLDEIIILYQKKLNQFYKLKKVYLQKMFI
ncbi:restriction endonuclease subunit S [Listeria seeligeri]|uniref:restriction endonuclease subunit S n=1 Tax=Listeria seeligeri TaxID=1640 RepID=UPI001624738F|nr:restriction endonuclease subunit S [Listeria seeligeri]MBC2071111.1 restriction endonuclease subunit S [Listeria seeligeri]MBF2355261.1 restriction endonuclease subunit S [Listeria seeligeri]